MCKVAKSFGTRNAVRFAFAGMTAALLAGCADSSRFIGDPLGNPFRSASNVPPAPVGDMAPPPPYQPSRVASIRSTPLAPPADMPTRRVADYGTAAHESPRLAANYVPPKTDRTASIAAPSGHGTWSATGGMAIIAATGETAGVLAARYNVPEQVLLHENGLASASDVHAGTRLIIPVYNANGGGGPASAPAPTRAAAVEPVRKPHDHSARERLLAKRDAHPADAKVARRDTPEPDKMHWVKGPQPAAMSKADRLKTEKLAKAEQLKSEQLKAEKLAKAEQARKTAKMEAAELKAAKKSARAEIARTAPSVVREQSAKVAKVEDTEKKVAVDPTPTASLPPPAVDKPSPSANGTPEFRWPAHGRIIQGFKTGGNDGINIAVPEGTAVKAAESGVVAYAGSEIKGFGNLVLIRHPNGYVTAYANNGDIEVKRGQQVSRGQTIAKSGQTGNVASPQLHFEVRKGSTPVDPTRYLAGL